MKQQPQNGFTLVEIAMVLVVIGLLIGGVLMGSNLMAGSKMRGMISQVESYDAAVLSFETAYGGLPGDITDATTYFPTAAGNGDGNRSYAATTEGYLAWNHLSLASFVPEPFSGTAVAGQSVLGTNVPVSKLRDGCGFGFMTMPGTANFSWGAASVGNLMVLGSTAAGGTTTGNCLSGAEAEELDRKTDDGLPHSGRVQSNNDSACTAAAAAPTTYAVAEAVAPPGSCTLLFYLSSN